MSATPDLTGRGTGEDRWRDAGVLDDLPRAGVADLVGAARVLVVAPHPDDEVLGAGGLLAMLGWAGHDVAVLGVTDGEGSHPHSPTIDPETLATRRRAERRAALSRLGLRPAELLGWPDGRIPEEALTRALAGRLRPGDVALAPRIGDGHPDHDVAARAAAAAAEATGARHLGYAVWFWHHAPPAALDGDAVRLDLPDAARSAKSEAIAAFTSQVTPLSDDPRDAAVLPPDHLARLDRSFEVFW